MLEYIREGIRRLFPADKDKIIEWKSEVTQQICSFLEVLIKSEKFVKLIDDFGIQLNKQTLQTLFIIVDHRSRFDTVAVKDLTANAASNKPNENALYFFLLRCPRCVPRTTVSQKKCQDNCKKNSISAYRP